MDHDHLTWPRLLEVLDRHETPGRWLLGLPLLLMETCAECRANCPDLLAMLEAGEIPESAGYFELALARSRRRARQAWKDLAGRSAQMLSQTLKRTPATYGLVDLLVEESRQQASMDCGLALRLAEAAVEMAQRLPVRRPDSDAEHGPQNEEPLDPAARAELLALAYAVLGNARRKIYRFEEAGAAFTEAYAYLEEARRAVYLFHAPARVFSLRASLLMDTRRLTEALQVLEAASDAAKDDGRTPTALSAEIAINQSLALGLADRSSEAIIPLRQILQKNENDLPPTIAFRLRHALAIQFVNCDLIGESRALLPQLHQVSLAVGLPLESLRVRWLEGRILCAEGQQQAALKVFEALQQDFLEQRAIHEAALLSLEIAGALLSLGRPRETEVHAREALALFLPLQLSKEMHGALALLARATERRSASHALIIALMRYAQGGPLPAELLWI
jgi:tetratricopeptide (TPR) repeat protein